MNKNKIIIFLLLTMMILGTFIFYKYQSPLDTPFFIDFLSKEDRSHYLQETNQLNEKYFGKRNDAIKRIENEYIKNSDNLKNKYNPKGESIRKKIRELEQEVATIKKQHPDISSVGNISLNEREEKATEYLRDLYAKIYQLHMNNVDNESFLKENIDYQKLAEALAKDFQEAKSKIHDEENSREKPLQDLKYYQKDHEIIRKKYRKKIDFHPDYKIIINNMLSKTRDERIKDLGQELTQLLNKYQEAEKSYQKKLMEIRKREKREETDSLYDIIDYYRKEIYEEVPEIQTMNKELHAIRIKYPDLANSIAIQYR